MDNDVGEDDKIFYDVILLVELCDIDKGKGSNLLVLFWEDFKESLFYCKGLNGYFVVLVGF